MLPLYVLASANGRLAGEEMVPRGKGSGRFASPVSFFFPFHQFKVNRVSNCRYVPSISIKHASLIFTTSNNFSVLLYLKACKIDVTCSKNKEKISSPDVLLLSSHGVISPAMRRTDETFGGSSQLLTGFCVDACRICM